MPPFVDQLQVPLIAIAAADTTEDYIFLRDKSDRCHFKNYWRFTAEGYRYSSVPNNDEVSEECPDWDGNEYDYSKGLRGDPDEESKYWPDLTISYDCGEG